jgi:hypothetical protein
MTQRPTHPTPEDPFYQAIGYVKGTFGEEQLHIRQGSYPAIAMLAARRKLSQVEGQPLRFSVYPKFNLKTGELKFLIRGWNEFSEEPDEWFLAGLWQFIPQYRRPVLAIHRNEKHWDGDKCKSAYLPFVWKDGPNPWKFNPRAEEKGRPMFICCTATLDRKFPRFFLKDELFQLEQSPRRVPKPPQERRPPDHQRPNQDFPSRPFKPAESEALAEEQPIVPPPSSPEASPTHSGDQETSNTKPKPKPKPKQVA